eukprot:14849813-Heterocapsa_arctica.AAC.1
MEGSGYASTTTLMPTLPSELAQGLHLEQVGKFIAAIGDLIPNYGSMKLNAVDQDKNPRAVRGSVSM